MKGLLKRVGMVRILECGILVLLMFGIFGPCFLEFFVPNAIGADMGIEEPARFVPFAGAKTLLSLYLAQLGLVLLNRRFSDILAASLGAVSVLWHAVPEFGFGVYSKAGGLGGYDYTWTAYGRAVSIAAVISFLVLVVLCIRQLRTPSAFRGFPWMLGTTSGRLRLMAVVLTVLALTGAFGACIRETGLPPEGMPVEDYLSFAECLAWLLPVMLAQLMLLISGRRAELALAGGCAGIAFMSMLTRVILFAADKTVVHRYPTVYSLTARGWIVMAMTMAAGALCLLQVEQRCADVS